VIEVDGKIFGITNVSKNKVNYNHPSNIEYIDADKLDDIFILRKWKNGDKFFPLGMKSSKKLSDFLTDLKIPVSEKKEKFVLVNRNNIIWVVGLRIDDKVKITGRTKKVFKLWIK